jgi:hypothetical protein
MFTAPVKKIKLPSPPCLGEALRRVFLIITLSLKNPNAAIFSIEFYNDGVREKVSLWVTLTI